MRIYTPIKKLDKVSQDPEAWICFSWLFTWYHGKVPTNHHLGEYMHLPKLTCPLKRDDFSREYIFQPLIFRGHVSFQGSIFYLFPAASNKHILPLENQQKNNEGGISFLQACADRGGSWQQWRGWFGSSEAFAPWLLTPTLGRWGS